jgi:hypothetical protein
MNELGLLGSKFRLVLNTNIVWYVVEIMLPKIHHFCIKGTKNYGGSCAVRSPAKTARQNLGVGIFRAC